MDGGFDIRMYVGALRRRLGLIAGIFVVGSLLAAAVAYFLPPVYRSTARILVESQQIPDDLARSTVTASAAERLAIIEQRLMTRNNINDLISRFGLYGDRTDLTLSEKIEKVRKATEIQSILYNQQRRDSAVSAFTITYAADSPALAARVANELVTMVLQQNLRSRSERATETHEFFRQEVSRLAGELQRLEGDIAKYKRDHENALPQSLDFRLKELSSLQERIFERDQRRVALEEQGRTLRQALAAGQISPDDVPLSPEERQLADLRSALVQKSSLYTPNHPEIRALKARIAAVEQSLSLSASRDGSDAEGDGDAQTSAGKYSPLGRQLELIDTQLKLLEDQQAASQKQEKALREAIAKTPDVEMELNAMIRHYTDLQTQYQIAVSKQSEAATGEKLEVNQQAERFEVIEQAQVPERPDAPNRILIALGGTVGSLGAGVGLGLVLELMNASIRTSADLERRLQLRPIVSIPYIWTDAERRRRRRMWLVGLAGALVVVILALWLVDQYLIPLELLLRKLGERSGIDAIRHSIAERIR